VSVIYVDFLAWGASEPLQRELCGLSGYVLRGAERERARADALHITQLQLPAPRPIAKPRLVVPTNPLLPGLDAWLDHDPNRHGDHNS
jgi:hypothetical protein